MGCAGSCGARQASITAQAHAFVASGLPELLSKPSWQPTFCQVARQGLLAGLLAGPTALLTALAGLLAGLLAAQQLLTSLLSVVS